MSFETHWHRSWIRVYSLFLRPGSIDLGRRFAGEQTLVAGLEALSRASPIIRTHPCDVPG